MENIHKIGRRKASIARIYLSKGSGNVKINNKDLNNYFSTDGLKSKINLPFIITDTLGKYDLSVNVSGGGNTGQADAIKLAISRALCEVNEEYRPLLKKEGLLTRDSRVVERKNLDKRKQERNFNGLKDKIIFCLESKLVELFNIYELN